MHPSTIKITDAAYPARLRERLGDRAPQTLTLLGPPELLSQPKTALFCSLHCPAEAIPWAHNLAQKLSDDSVTVISGFHSPVEKQCLSILLRGKQPIIICVLRPLTQTTRIPAEWRKPLDASRLLLLSSIEKQRRPDKETARKRNELVAALCDDLLIIHAERGGGVERLSELAQHWGVSRYNSGPSVV